MIKKIRKAVFPVAGLGTRFLPATKSMPKEMLTIVDRPVIQHVVDEARAAGIEQFIFVTGRNKHVIEDHFDRNVELDCALDNKKNHKECLMLHEMLPGPGQAVFTRQQQPLGLGHAIWCARNIVGNEPFAVLLPDVITQCPDRSCLRQLIDVYVREGGNHVAIEQVDPNDVSQYGIVALASDATDARKITAMIEKPTVESAPSNLSIVGRYILQPEIFDVLENCSVGVNGEIQLTDAMRKLMERQAFFGIEYGGRSFDCGSKIGFLTANIALALARPDLADEFREKLIELIPEAGIDASRIIVGLMHGAPRGRSRLKLVG